MKQSEPTSPVRITKTAMAALKAIQERQAERIGMSESYSSILSKLAIKEAREIAREALR